jgi:hypothetical protein
MLRHSVADFRGVFNSSHRAVETQHRSMQFFTRTEHKTLSRIHPQARVW